MSKKRLQKTLEATCEKDEGTYTPKKSNYYRSNPWEKKPRKT